MFLRDEMLSLKEEPHKLQRSDVEMMGGQRKAIELSLDGEEDKI